MMANYTLLKSARLFDGNTDRAIADSWVLIENDRIASLGQGNPTAPQGSKVVDVAGQTVMPGLIDTHVHTLMMGDEGMRLFIAAGVTAARDCGGRLEGVKGVQKALAAGEKLGPRLYVCGPLLQGTVQSLPEPFASIMLESVPSPDAVPDKLKPLLENEVDCIKLYFTLPAETGQRIISYVGGSVPVTGHLGWMRASEAVKAGINGLEHVSISPFQDICPLQHRWGPNPSMMSREWGQKLHLGWQEADLGAPATKDLIAHMAQRQVALGTLLSVDWMTLARLRRDPPRSGPALHSPGGACAASRDDRGAWWNGRGLGFAAPRFRWRDALRRPPQGAGAAVGVLPSTAFGGRTDCWRHRCGRSVDATAWLLAAAGNRNAGHPDGQCSRIARGDIAGGPLSAQGW